MSIVVNAINSICHLNHLNHDVQAEALRLAAETTPRIGRAGWARRQAEGILAQAERALKKARYEKVVAARAAAEAAEVEKKRADREALEAAGKAAGGFRLVDVNPFYHNCGHYPEWRVAPGGAIPTLEMAEALANQRNARSNRAWQAFLDA